MLFLLHLFGLVYGLASFLATAFRTSAAWEATSPAITGAVERFFPESLFKPWQEGVSYPAPDMTRTRFIGFGLVLYCGKYLFSKHRG